MSLTGMAPDTYEHWVQRAEELVTRERAAQWEQARVAAQANPVEQAQLASLWGCATARVRALGRLWDAYAMLPRAMDRSVEWHAAVWRAAQRTGMGLGEMLDTALVSAWNLRALAQQGRATEAVSLAAVCPTCGCRVVVTQRTPGIRARLVGCVIACPVCPATPTPQRLGRLG